MSAVIENTAVHESAHAVVANALGDIVTFITVHPEEARQQGHHGQMRHRNKIVSCSRLGAARDIVITAAGVISDIWQGCDEKITDKSKINELADQFALTDDQVIDLYRISADLILKFSDQQCRLATELSNSPEMRLIESEIHALLGAPPNPEGELARIAAVIN